MDRREKSLEGYSPCDRKELNTTEGLHKDKYICKVIKQYLLF